MDNRSWQQNELQLRSKMSKVRPPLILSGVMRGYIYSKIRKGNIPLRGEIFVVGEEIGGGWRANLIYKNEEVRRVRECI